MKRKAHRNARRDGSRGGVPIASYPRFSVVHEAGKRIAIDPYSALGGALEALCVILEHEAFEQCAGDSAFVLGSVDRLEVMLQILGDGVGMLLQALFSIAMIYELERDQC